MLIGSGISSLSAPEEVRAKAIAAASDRTLELDEALADAHMATRLEFRKNWNGIWRRRCGAYERAAGRSAPNYAIAHSYVWSASGTVFSAVLDEARLQYRTRGANSIRFLS